MKNPSSSGQVITVQTENVGAGGVCVLLTKPLERFSVLSLRIELDPHLPWIECQGKVVWSVPSRDNASNRENFDTGVEFMNLGPAQQDLVRQYVGARLKEEKIS